MEGPGNMGPGKRVVCWRPTNQTCWKQAEKCLCPLYKLIVRGCYCIPLNSPIYPKQLLSSSKGTSTSPDCFSSSTAPHFSAGLSRTHYKSFQPISYGVLLMRARGNADWVLSQMLGPWTATGDTWGCVRVSDLKCYNLVLII